MTIPHQLRVNTTHWTDGERMPEYDFHAGYCTEGDWCREDGDLRFVLHEFEDHRDGVTEEQKAGS